VAEKHGYEGSPDPGKIKPGQVGHDIPEILATVYPYKNQHPYPKKEDVF
jgi:hypothetical protein